MPKHTMKYNDLGRNGVKLSHLSLGGGVFSHLYSGFDQKNAMDAIRYGLQQGINYIDTAPWYGQGSSEKTIGLALQGVPRHSYYIGTKVGRYETEVDKMFDFSYDKTTASIDKSLELLGLNYVDIIQVHDITFAPDSSTIVKETLPALAKAVADGKAHYIGITDYEIDSLMELVEESPVPISTVLSYAKSTLIDNRLQKHIGYFKDKGVAVINASGNAMGLLTNQGAQAWHPAGDDIKSTCLRASKYCQENGVELARLAQWYTLQMPNLVTNLSGMQTVQQVEDTLDVMSNGLTQHEKKVLEDLQERFFNKGPLHWDMVELPLYQAKLEEKLKLKK